MHIDQLTRLTQALQELTDISENPDLIRKACFYVGWQLRSPNSWEYRDLWTNQWEEVNLSKLIEAVQAKRDRLNPQIKVEQISYARRK